MSYFAKPNYLVYDEWFDDDIEKTKIDFKKKIKSISNIHEFFYEQSNYKVGASENNLTQEIKVNKKELIANNYLQNNSVNFTSVSNKELILFKRIPKINLKFEIKNRIIYFLTISSFLIIFGFVIFFIWS
ncbi:MAG: hypothetical protein JJ844_01850 [Prochlorococcus marinus CUG1435]|nr:hypothetical protein [Prochlorococcus marinus CUG1435]